MQRQIARLKGKRDKGRGDGTPLSDFASELPNLSIQMTHRNRPKKNIHTYPDG